MIEFLTQSVRTGMTFLYGSTGETLTEKSGHLNLGLPGIMSAGAAFGCAVEYAYGNAVGKLNVNPLIAVLLPILVSFIGGMLMGYEKTGDMAKAFRYGIAAGAASVMTEGTQLIVRSDFEKLLAQVKVQEV